MKLKSWGVKPKQEKMPMVSAAPAKPNYPTVNLSSKHVSNLADLKVGDKCKILCEGEIVSMNKGEDWGIDTGFRAEFRLTKGTVQPNVKPKNINEASHSVRDEMMEKEEK